MNPFADFGITFVNPWMLLGLLAIPVLAWLRGHRGASATVVFSSTGTLRALGKRANSRAGNFLTGLLYLALALLILALARPQKGHTLSHVEASGIDIILAIDVSASMLVEDFTIGGERANRLEAVKKVTEEFISRRPHDRIGIVAFSGRPYLVSPLTLDHDWLLSNMDRLQVGLVEDGTAIGSALASATNRLRGDRAAKSRVVVLLTDGDNNRGQISPETAAEAARAMGVKVYTIGAGTDEPAPWPQGKDMFGRTRYTMAQFPLDVETLRKVAEIGGGEFFRATDAASLTKIYDRIDELEKSTFEVKKYSRYRDLYAGFLAAGAGLLFLHLLLSQTIWRKVP